MPRPPALNRFSYNLAMSRPPLPHLTRRQWSGVACIYAAGLLWLADFTALFSAWPNKWAVFALAAGAGEGMFVLGVLLLGKQTYRQLKTAYHNYLKSAGRKPQ